jgi:hypothetical protein
VVIPRDPAPPTEPEARAIGVLPYSPSDIALAWLPGDTLLVAHMEIYRAIDAVAGTCEGSGFYAISTHGGTARPIAVGPPACAATRTLPAATPGGSHVVFSVPADRALRLARLELATMRVDTLRTGCVTQRYPAIAGSGALAWAGCVLGEDGIFTWRSGDAPARKLSGSTDVDTRFPSWSPDGARIAYSVGRRKRSLVVSDTSGASRALGVDGDAPSWSPDGEWIAYLIRPEYPCAEGIGVARADGTGARTLWVNEVVTTYSVGQGPAREGQTCGPVLWSPDSDALVFPRYFVAGESLWTLGVRSGNPKQITAPAR